MNRLIIAIAQWAIPVLLIVIIGVAYQKKVRVYEVFIQGAMEGLKTTLKLTPYILAIFVAIGIFRDSGAVNFLVYLFRPLLTWLNIPPDIITLGFLKPLSGSAALGLTAEILNKYGPDSRVGIIASLIQGSSETTFYVLSLYLGAINLKKARHLVLVGLTNDGATFLLALLLGTLLFTSN